MQAAMGLTALAAGVAKIAGADFMVDAFDALGLGASFRLLAGAVEVMGGLCLLMPKAGLLGAVMLGSVVVGAAGLTVGQVAGRVAGRGLPGFGAGGMTEQAVSRSATQLAPVAFRDDGMRI